ncbi:Ca2+:H+ antiporter [Fusarium proliferatum]|uniref:Ca2+:H+ antiporter n=1 Tax=Gibberella intermedia TaxID=948311 RepID=A0A365MW93_GIBIN|nr:Ca2+:H+ antiporter [Fusarium proliferatum]
MTGRGVQEPTLEPITAVAVLVVTAVLVTRYTDCLVDGINGLATTSGISRGFIGLILIPFVANAAGHVTTVTFAFRDKMEHAMSVAFGSSIQTDLLVAPFLVILRSSVLTFSDMTTAVQTVAFAVSVTYTIKDGKSKYLEGAMLMGLYIIVALAFHVTLSGIMDTSK